MDYVVLTVALALACVAGIQFIYLLFMEMQSRQLKRRIHELEKINLEIMRDLQRTETLFETLSATDEGEAWPEFVDDGPTR